MIAYISALLLLTLSLLTIVLQKTYYFFPARELKRQARTGDREAAVLYRAVAYGASLRLFLWLVIGVTVAGGYALLTTVAPGWLVFLAVMGLIWYAFAWAPHARVGSLEARIVLLVTPAIAWILYYAQPVLARVARSIDKRRPVIFHTGLFEREDLIELIRDQQDVVGSRIPKGELDMVLHSLSFGEKTVGSIMIPEHTVKSVKADDVIGPILMDELYEDKHSRFPVIGDKKGTIVGTLYLRDLISARHGGTIKDVMVANINYVHEEQTLYKVLHAFLTTKHSMFIVINSEQTYVGIITIEDVLEQVIGHKIEDDFDSYEDKRAVAASVDEPRNQDSKTDNTDVNMVK